LLINGDISEALFFPLYRKKSVTHKLQVKNRFQVSTPWLCPKLPTWQEEEYNNNEKTGSSSLLM
jgi:hypothetical protein